MTNLVMSEQIGAIRILTLNRPDRLNAINPPLVSALLQSLTDANANDDTSVIILKGAGRAFCTGNDLKQSAESMGEGWDPDHASLHVRELQEITRQIINGEKMVIGAINGWAVGAGFEWAINCDFTIWAEDAQAFFPEVSWGLSATGGVMTLLPRIVGIAKAREMLLLGDKYTAVELLDLGLASRVVPKAELENAALEAAEKIVRLPRRTVGQFKKTFNRAVFMNLEQTLQAETDTLTNSLKGPDAKTRVKEFESAGRLPPLAE